MEGFSRWRVPRLLVVALVLLAAMVLVACGGGGGSANDQESDGVGTEQAAPGEDGDVQDEAAPGDEEDPAAELEEVTENFFRHLGDVSKRFQRVVYRWEDPTDSLNNARVRFEFVGRDNIDGVGADEVFLVMESADGAPEIRAWVNDDGQVLRMIIDGDEQPLQVVSSFGQTIFMAALWPFGLSQEFDILQAIEEDEEQVVITSHTRRSEVLAGLRATVHEFTGYHDEPGVDANFTYRFAHFGDFALILGWKAVEDGRLMEMELIPEEIVLR